jgi:hypothetical protein
MMKTLARMCPLLLALCLSAPAAQAGGGYAARSKFFVQANANTHGAYGGSAYGAPLASQSAFSHYGRYSGYGQGNACPPQKVWVPGAWSLHKQQVWLPGATQKIWHAPAFETRFDLCGKSFQVQLSPGYYETVHAPGRWTWQSQRVWSPAHWEFR